jgi:hypothetical protein
MAASAAWLSSACIGVSTTPSETAFTRIRFRAYSIASDFVTNAVAALGERCQRRRHVDISMFDQGGGHIDHVPTIALVEHLRNDGLREEEEARHVHAGGKRVVLGCVRGERLGDEHPCVVDQGVHPAEAFDRRCDDTFRGARIGDVTRDREQFGIARIGNRRELANTA